MGEEGEKQRSEIGRQKLRRSEVEKLKKGSGLLLTHHLILTQKIY